LECGVSLLISSLKDVSEDEEMNKDLNYV